MPGANLNQPLLDAGANYQAEDWGQASASSKLNLLASAELRRGINLGLGAEALVEVTGSFRKFLAIDANAQASAAARVQAQVQVPLDLFSEAGFALRLQAVAEAAVGISLGIGISVGDFLQQAGSNPEMKGAPMKLLALLLQPNQVVFSAGVKAKAAVSAMAYANFLVTASLVGNKPGFLIAAEAGLGLKAGAGYQVFANFGLSSPHAFLRKSIDIAVDETLRLVAERVSDLSLRPVVSELRAPAKIAFRSAFELGWALAEGAGAFNPNAGPQLAQRLTIVILEEGQRLLLESLTNFALDSFQRLLRSSAISQSSWDSAQALRDRLANRLRQMPEDPFEPTQANRDHWTSLLADMLQAGTQLAGSSSVARVNELGSIAWSALQLLFRSTERISSFQVRHNIIGVPANTSSAAFGGALPQQPPPEIRRFINTAITRAPTSVLAEDQLVEFLGRDALLQPLLQAAPNLQSVLDVVFGPAGGGGIAAAKVLLREAGAFVADATGSANSEATLRALLAGLRAYLDTRLQTELLPVVRQALAGDRDLELYLDEVLLPTVNFSADLLMNRVLAWRQSSALDQTALREACSGILFKLAGRSLVVTLDVLLNTALSTIQSEFRNAARHVNDARGVAQLLSQVTGLDRAFVAELMEETLSLSADTFGPLPDERRRRVRALMFRLLDVVPMSGSDEFLSQLKDSFFVPNLDAAVELATEAGDLIADNLQRFITALFARLGALILEELRAVFEAVEAEVQKWLQQLERVAQELLAALRELEEQIERFLGDMQRAWNNAFDALEATLSALGGSGRSPARNKVKAALVKQAVRVLEDNSVYRNLPREAKSFAEDRLRDAIGGLLNNELFDDVWEAVGSLSAGAADLMEDVRDLDLDSNLTGQITALVLDRVEDAIYDLFGGSNPRIAISFHVRLDLGVVRIDNPINLGNVRLPLNELISAVRDGLSGLAVFENSVRLVASSVTEALEAAGRLAAAQAEHEATQEEHSRITKELDHSTRADFGIEILSPSPTGFYETSTVEIEIFLKKVPLSYLGLGDLEEQRVTVFLNREELEPDTFVVEEHAGPDHPEPPPLRLAGRVDVIGNDATRTVAAAVGSRKPNPILRYQPGTAVGPWGQTLLFEPATVHSRARLDSFRTQQGRTVPPPSDAHERALFAARSAKARSGSRPTSRKALPTLGAGIGRQQSDALSGTSRFAIPRDPPLIGRISTVRERLDRLDALENGLLLRLQLSADRFVEGPNTIAVAVIPGRGPRLEQTVSFALSGAGPAIRPKIPVIKDPTRDVPMPGGLRGFEPGKKQPAPAGARPAKGGATWRPLKKDRVKMVQSAVAQHAAKSGKTVAAMGKRLETAKARGLAGIPHPTATPPPRRRPTRKRNARAR